jgi:hypothetical protein
MFCLREIGTKKIVNSENCSGSLSKWCKIKKSGGAKCKRHRSIDENFKISGGAPAHPHIHTAPPMLSTSNESNLVENPMQPKINQKSDRAMVSQRAEYQEHKNYKKKSAN